MAWIDPIDVTELPAAQNYDPLPAGTYTAKIAEATVGETKSGTGRYIKLRWDILGPSHQGRVVFQNLNVRNQSAMAEEIGRAQLGEVMRAVGLPRIEDTDQLVGGEASITLKIRQDNNFGPRNDVTTVKALSGRAEPAAMPSAPPAAAKPAPRAASGAPPWAKKI